MPENTKPRTPLQNHLMNKFLLSILLTSFFGASAQDNNSKTKTQFRSLGWLAGSWERTNAEKGTRATEKWLLASPTELKGSGVTMNGLDTVFHERIQLRITNSEIFYVADVKENKAPVYFKVIEITARGFVCENREHDFPKKIEYSLKDKNLTVIISGDGKSQDLLFVRR
jgi:hypothetical protein